MAKKWIQGAIRHPGALRSALHTKKGKNIPKMKLEKAAHSKKSSSTMKKRANLAITLRKMHKK